MKVYSGTGWDQMSNKFSATGGTMTGNLVLTNNSTGIHSKDAAGVASRILTMDNADTLILGNPTTVDDIRFDVDTYGEGAMFIKSDGNVGIGNTVPQSFNAQAHNLVVGTGGGAEGISIYSANNSSGNLFFADGYSTAEDATRGGISYQHGTNQMQFRVNDANRMEITSDGKVGIGTTTPTSGLEIKDRGLAVGSGSTASGTVGSVAIGHAVTASGERSFVFGREMTVSGDYSFGIALNDQNGTNLSAANTMAIVGGNVGIGTITPSNLLTLAETGGDLSSTTVTRTNATGIKIHDTGLANQGNGIWFDSGALLAGIASTRRVTTNWGTDLRFYTHPDATSNVNDTYERMRIDPDGHIVTSSALTLGDRMALGNASTSEMSLTTKYSSYIWRGFGAMSNSNLYWINAANAGVYMTYGGTSWNTHSDERVKENIVSLGTVLPDLLGMRCVKYNRIGDTSADKTKIGFIAQDWEGTEFSEVVDEDDGFVIEDDGTVSTVADSESTIVMKSVAYTETIPILLKAIQELSAKVTALENA